MHSSCCNTGWKYGTVYQISTLGPVLHRSTIDNRQSTRRKTSAAQTADNRSHCISWTTPAIMVASEEQIQFHRLLSQIFLWQSLPTYVITRYVIVAPFGRHVPNNNIKINNKQKNNGHSKYRWWFGPQFNARISWVVFESPNLIWACYYLCFCGDPSSLYLDTSPSHAQTSIISWENNQLQISTNFILISLFAMHYINRAIIYPLRMNPNSNKVPVVVILFAFVITTWNGYLQCFYLTQIEQYAPLTISMSVDNIQHWLGICLFFLGMGINMHSDGVLRNLRKHGPSPAGKDNKKKEQQTTTKHTYYIPHSPFFKYISCPNLGGEMLEWFGFTMACQFSLPSVAFFVYTVSNLIPRAVAHHEWYLRKFEDYPVERKWAAIPFVV